MEQSIEREIAPCFGLERMIRPALGRNWRLAGPERQRLRPPRTTDALA
jgi:hypothetical protein